MRSAKPPAIATLEEFNFLSPIGLTVSQDRTNRIISPTGGYTLLLDLEHASKWTPRGWLPDGALVRGEQQLYLRQPGYGTSYLSGKIQIEELMAERALQLGDEFTIGRFFDEFFHAGVIPVTLARWEMTGTQDPILGGGG